MGWSPVKYGQCPERRKERNIEAGPFPKKYKERVSPETQGYAIERVPRDTRISKRECV